jgi:hypothetical protein
VTDTRYFNRTAPTVDDVSWSMLLALGGDPEYWQNRYEPIEDEL